MEPGFIMEHAWLIPALPFFGFLVTGLFVRPFSDRAAGLTATLAVAAAALCAYALGWNYYQMTEGPVRAAMVPWSFEWLRFMPGFAVTAGVLVDPISVMLMVVVTTVSSLVHLYSISYMHGEKGYGRYFTYLNLFTFSMLGLVTAPNILQMYVSWELVGASSFLLIGFYYQKPSAVAASKKAFIVTRFADLGFLLGVLILGYYAYGFYNTFAPALGPSLYGVQPFDFAFLTRPEILRAFQGIPDTVAGVHVFPLALLLLFMGAAGKSAMFPLHIWLPDAMEGPTPVSALIHAATMVVAGVYLVARMFPAFSAAGDPLVVVACVGAFTSLFAAVIGCTQDDIKRVLAFSTLSQLGYMMFSLGVARMDEPLGFQASMFHLFTHAFFKALLFLGAGAVIHAVHSNSIWDMGGLRKRMPLTHAAFLIATLAIAGIWPFAGFFSKDEILASALHSGNYLIFATGLLVAGMTAFYMFRIYFVTFWGKERSPGAHHAHEAGPLMLIPLGILAVLSAVAGFIPIPDFVNPSHLAAEAHHGIDFMIAGPATLLALGGISLAWFLYGSENNRAAALAKGLGPVYTTIKNKFYIDEVYQFITHRLVFAFVARPIAWFDRNVVDGGVNLSAWITRTSGGLLSTLQTGQVQTYSAWFAGGAVALGFILWAAIL